MEKRWKDQEREKVCEWGVEPEDKRSKMDGPMGFCPDGLANLPS